MIGLEILPVGGLPEVERGARLGALIAEAAGPTDADVLVVSQKVVSKAEGRVRRLAEVKPTDEARALATSLDRDPALVQLVLEESRSVIRAEAGVLITESRSGWICANAGIDASNVPEEGTVTLLPENPDASARRVRVEVREACGAAPAVVISDSFGRPWRLGQTDVVLGCAGLVPLDDRRGDADRAGRELRATVIAIADEVAAAADLVREKAAGVPAAVVRGLGRYVTAEDGPGAGILQRPREDDLFR